MRDFSASKNLTCFKGPGRAAMFVDRQKYFIALFHLGMEKWRFFSFASTLFFSCPCTVVGSRVQWIFHSYFVNWFCKKREYYMVISKTFSGDGQMKHPEFYQANQWMGISFYFEEGHCQLPRLCHQIWVTKIWMITKKLTFEYQHWWSSTFFADQI